MKNDKKKRSNPGKNAPQIGSDVDELRAGVSKAAARPDTTGHLVWMVIVVLLSGIVTGAVTSALGSWLAITGGDPLALESRYPDYLLDIAEVYNSVPNFATGLTWLGVALVLILCLYSLIKRYTWKWVTYAVGALFIGFFVNVLAWALNFRATDVATTIERWQPSLYHIALGGVFLMLFAMLISKKHNLLKALLVAVLGAFVFFEVQMSYGAMQVVNETIASSWSIEPKLAASYSLIGGLAAGVLLLGGLLLLIEALAYYDGMVPAKGTLFMFIIVGIPAAFLLWESMTFGEFQEANPFTVNISGGVAEHYQAADLLPDKDYLRTAYVFESGSSTLLDLSINPSLRDTAKAMTDMVVKSPTVICGEDDADWLLASNKGLRAMSNLDIPLWYVPLAFNGAYPDLEAGLARQVIEPYFDKGCWSGDTVEDLLNQIAVSRSAVTVVKICAARQMIRRGDFVRAEELLKEVRTSFERLRNYKFFKSEKYAPLLAQAEQELLDGRAVGAGRIDFRIRVEYQGIALPGAYVGLQHLGYTPQTTLASEMPTDEGVIPPGGTESPDADTPPVPTGSERELDIEDGKPATPEMPGKPVDSISTAPDAPSVINDPTDLLTEYRQTDATGVATFNEFIGGRYRIIVLAAPLGEPEPIYIGSPTITPLPPFFSSGLGTFNIVVTF